MSLTTSTWTGSAKTTWNNAAAWSDGVPGAGTVADIAASHVLNYKGFASFAEADVSGTLNIANGSYLTLTTADGGSGALDIAAGGQVNFTTTGGTLELQGGIVGDATINFGGTASPGVLFWNPTDPAVTISAALTLDNFFLDSELDVTTGSYTGSYSYDPSTDVLTLGGVGAVSLAHSYTAGAPDYTTSDFTVVNDGGTLEITSSYP